MREPVSVGVLSSHENLTINQVSIYIHMNVCFYGSLNYAGMDNCYKVNCTCFQVMLAKNMDVHRGLVNGARGVVKGFEAVSRG